VTSIGPYRIAGVIRGGPRPLYRVTAPDGRQLALKTIPAAGVTAEIRERFEREAAICTALDHPNLVRVHDAGEAGGILYQAMDWLEGADLSQVLAERRALDWEQKLSIMEQVCDGLAYAHARELVHRDIKPANLFLENSGRLRILDFGMARVADSELTRAGSAVGTLTYMAPEQIRGQKCVPASDVFAAGIVFYELATGKHPFGEGERDLTKVLTAIMFQAPPPLKTAAPDAPDGLDLVLGKALEKDAAGRLQNAADLKQALAVCRITLRLRPAAAAAGQAPSMDPGKTIVMPRSFRPPAAPAPVRAPETPPAPPAPKPAPKLDLVFCTNCTHGNPKDARICQGCGLPLAAARVPAAEPGDSQVWWILAAAIVLAVVLLVWGMSE